MRRMTRCGALLAGLANIFVAGSVAAHQVPGLPNRHWHAGDSMLFLMSALVAAAAWVWWRGRR